MIRYFSILIILCATNMFQASEGILNQVQNSLVDPETSSRAPRRSCPDPEEAVISLITSTDYRFKVDMLTSCSYEQRLDIKYQALDVHNVNLKARFYIAEDDEPCWAILRYLISNHTEIYVDAIHDALVNEGVVDLGIKLPADELTLFLAMLPDDLKDHVKRVYWNYYITLITDEIARKFSSHAEKLLEQLFSEDREQGRVLSEEQVSQIVEELHHSDDKVIDINLHKDYFIKIFTTKSFPDLLRIFNRYQETFSYSIEKAIANEFLFVLPTERDYLIMSELVLIARNELMEWTRTLCNELSVRKDAIATGRIMILRSGRDLKYIRLVYAKLCFRRSIEQEIQDYLGEAAYPLLRLLERPENIL